MTRPLWTIGLAPDSEDDFDEDDEYEDDEDADEEDEEDEDDDSDDSETWQVGPDRARRPAGVLRLTSVRENA
jgi:hypothetical protein